MTDVFDETSDGSFLAFLQGLPSDDATCIARFFLKPVLLGKRSRDEGRPIYEDREFVEIKVKGQPQQVVHEQVTDAHRQRFPRAYAAFKAGQEMPVIGTPIEMLPGLPPSRLDSMKAIGMRTIEDIANAPEFALQKMGMGARELQDKARAFLGKSTQEVVKMQDELRAKDKQLADMQQQMAHLQAQIEALAKPRRPGRPRKAAPDAGADNPAGLVQ